MNVTRTQQYALRAVFELAKRKGKGPTKINRIAQIQAIPTRFLEVILNKLKHGGLVDAKRGAYGGYTLLESPDRITVDDVFRHLGDSKEHPQCVACMSSDSCPLDENCVFISVWSEVQSAIARVYKETTIQDLLDRERIKTAARKD